MAWNKQQRFPYFKKSLKKFLTDESGRITKKDALWLSATGVLLAWIQDVSWHANVWWTTSGNYTYSTNPAWFNPFPSNGSVPNNGSATETWTINNGATCNHASWIVNGHFSNVPSVNISSETVNFTNTHGSHGSHGSWGWC